MKLPDLSKLMVAGAGRRTVKTPSRKELLSLRPLRNPELEWCEDQGQVVLTVTGRPTWKSRLVQLLFPLAVPAPHERRVVLDAIGTEVWRMMDGQSSIGQISRSLAQEYKLMPQEAEMSLHQHLRELVRRGYILLLQEGPAPAAPPEQSALPDGARRRRGKRQRRAAA